MTKPDRLAATTPEHQHHELIAGWRVLLGSMIGIGVGIIALPGPAVMVTMRSLQDEFGWTRAEISLGPTILLTTLAFVAPVLGWVSDRVGAAKIVVVSLGALSACLFAFSQMGASLVVYYGIFVVLGVLGCGAATIVYARAISLTFVRMRGLALGLAMVGNGLTGIFLPIVLAPYAVEHGWRAVFSVLALVSFLAMPVIGFLLRRIEPQAAPVVRINPDLIAGKTFAEGLRDRVLWIMALCFLLIPLSAAGLQLHFMAYLSDAGIKPTTAGFIGGTMGVTLIVGRVLTGYLIDRFFAPLVGAALMLVCAACMAIQGVWGVSAALLGALAIGLSIGAELDLIGYLVSRYFGMKAYGRIYGLMYTMVLAGSSLSNIAYGLILDATGAYTNALYTSSGLFALSAALFMMMRRFAPMPTPVPDFNQKTNNTRIAPVAAEGHSA